MALEVSGEGIARTKPQEKVKAPKFPIGKKTRLFLAGLAALGTVETTGAIVNEQINQQPISAHSVVQDLAWPWNLGKSAIEDIRGLFSKNAEQDIEKKFPIKLEQSSFTPVTKEEEQKLWENTKTVDLENHTFTIGFPFDQATIDKNPNIKMAQQFDAILPPFIDAKKLEQDGVKNLENISGLSQGAEYKITYDDARFDASVIILSTAGVTETVGSNSFSPAYTSYCLILRDKETGKSAIQQTISGLYAEPLIQTEPFPTQVSPVYENGTSIKSGNSILRLTTSLQDWDGKTGQPLPGQKGQFTTRSAYQQENPRAPIPLTTNFLRSSDSNIASQQ